MRVLTAIVACLLAGACTAAEQPGERGAPVVARWPELVGSWSGAGDHPELGRVRALLTVAPAGTVSVTLLVRGAPISAVLQIDAWDGRELTVSRAGQTTTLAARLAGDELTASLPGLGDVLFRRQN